jgi:hypothetical protein
MFGKNKPAMTETQRRRWEQIRERGEAIFCTQRALMIGGIALVVHAYRGIYVQHHPMTEVLMSAIEPTLSGCFTGLIEGVWEWSSNEKHYLRGKNQSEPVDASSLKWSVNSQRGTLNGKEY